MSKRKKPVPVLYKVKSLYNEDTYYSSADFPERYIDGQWFKGVKKTPSDNRLLFILKDNIKIVSNE